MMRFILILSLVMCSCMETHGPAYMIRVDTSSAAGQKKTVEINDTKPVYTPKMPDDIFCDLDGDGKKDTMGLRLDTSTSKYGLLIKYAAGRVDTLGMGKIFLDRGFNDFNWAGIMEVAPKGTFYWNYADYQDQNIPKEQVPDKDKITLKRDGIFLHADEACGGGVIYLNDDLTYAWMQQE